MISPEGKALHDLFREFTQTLRYDTDDPDLFERLVSDPRYEATTNHDKCDADYEAGRNYGYDQGYADAVCKSVDETVNRSRSEASKAVSAIFSRWQVTDNWTEEEVQDALVRIILSAPGDRMGYNLGYQDGYAAAIKGASK